MATDIAKITITGRIGKEPEGEYTPEGTFLCKSSLAVNVWVNKAEGTNWYNLAIWGKSGERFKEWIHKGDDMTIEGSLVLREWKDKEGATRTSADLNVTDFKSHTYHKKDESTDNPY